MDRDGEARSGEDQRGPAVGAAPAQRQSGLVGEHDRVGYRLAVGAADLDRQRGGGDERQRERRRSAARARRGGEPRRDRADREQLLCAARQLHGPLGTGQGDPRCRVPESAAEAPRRRVAPRRDQRSSERLALGTRDRDREAGVGLELRVREVGLFDHRAEPGRDGGVAGRFDPDREQAGARRFQPEGAAGIRDRRHDRLAVGFPRQRGACRVDRRGDAEQHHRRLGKGGAVRTQHAARQREAGESRSVGSEGHSEKERKDGDDDEPGTNAHGITSGSDGEGLASRSSTL